MGIIKTKGLVILESNMNDYDKMITILTPDKGKIGVAARGARRSKSTMIAGTQFLSFSDFILYHGPSSYSVNSCETIEVFYNIRTDLEKLNYAATICRMVYDVTDENQYTYQILQLLLNTLYMISETNEKLDFIYAVFQMRLMTYLGFTPQLGKCSICGTQNDISYFSIQNSGFECKVCGKTDKSALAITEDTFHALKYIVSAPAKKIFSFKVSEESLKELKLISKLYITDKLDKEYPIL